MATRSRRKRMWRVSDTVFAYILNVPSVLIILALVAFPIVYSFIISLKKYNLKRPHRIRFVGLQNYLDIVQEPLFWHSLQVTAYFVCVSIILILVLGIALALLMNESFRGRGLLRSLILIPWAIPPVINGLMWQWVYNGRVGVLNGLLYSLGLIDEYIGWLSQPFLALNLVAFAHVWNNTPFAAIILLSALQAIPEEQYRASMVDGAGLWQRFRHVTIPWLLHPILIIMIYQTMVAFRVFDLIYTITGGGPARATYVIAWQTYTVAFGDYDFGHGNAYSYIITLITMTLAIVYIRLLYRRGVMA